MAEKFDLLTGIDENTARDTQTNAPATATQAAPGADKQLFITGFVISQSGTAPAAGTYTVSIRRNAGATTIKQFLVPAAAIAPIIYEFKRPIRIPENQSADIQISALGAGAVVIVELWTITRPVTGGA